MARRKLSDIDLDVEEVVVGAKRFTNADADALAAELESTPPRGRGRPSLTGVSQDTPQIAVRVSPALRERLQSRAEREGKKLSEVVRDALEAYSA